MSSKLVTIIGFLILLIIGGIILFPKQQESTEAIPITPDGSFTPSVQTMKGPSTPPPIK